MSLDNNKTEIIKNWKRLWHKHKVSIFGQYVELATEGKEYPDFTGYTSPSNEPEGSEDELINEHIINPDLIW